MSILRPTKSAVEPEHQQQFIHFFERPQRIEQPFRLSFKRHGRHGRR